MSLTEKEVRHVAKLACIELSENEVQQFTKELSAIINYFDKLSQINTKGVPPTSHVHGVVNVFRDDRVIESIQKEDAKNIAPKWQEGSFVVPK
jgi:aspartyl-tRNA(Asn)/glutamyl-tRNA(Gln) amidotransferase subunit C